MGYMYEFPHTQTFDSDLREILELFITTKNLPNEWETYKELMDSNFKELRDFVTNYFDDLDVQNEINQKLDDMVSDGTFDTILSNLFGDYINVKNYGAVGDGVNDDYSAIYTALNTAITTNKPLFFPNGIYYISKPLVIPTCNGLTIFGINPELSIIKGKIVINENNILTGLKISDMGFDGNEGICINCKGWLKYSEIFNCHFINWTNCLYISYFENVNILNSEFTKAVTNGKACITCGRKGNGSSGANLTIENCLLNGNLSDDTNINCAVGILILDCDAVWITNTDIGRFVDNAVKITPTYQSNNHHIESSYLDVTKTGHSLFITGTGTVNALSITDTWFASSSYVSNVGGCGIYADNGNIGYMLIDSCRFYNIRGTGCHIVNNTFFGVITNNIFHDIGLANVDGFKNGIYLSTPSEVLANAIIKGNTFYNCKGNATKFGADTQGYELNDNSALYCTLSTNGKFINCKNNSPVESTVAVAKKLDINLASDFFTVTGDGVINNITPCKTGKEITLWFTGSVSFGSGNVTLAGSISTTPNTILKLVSVSDTWIEISRSVK